MKWHRTPKSAILDLRVDAQREGDLALPYHRRPVVLATAASSVIPKAVSRADDFWRRYNSVGDPLAAFVWLKEYFGGDIRDDLELER